MISYVTFLCYIQIGYDKCYYFALEIAQFTFQIISQLQWFLIHFLIILTTFDNYENVKNELLPSGFLSNHFYADYEYECSGYCYIKYCSIVNTQFESMSHSMLRMIFWNEKSIFFATNFWHSNFDFDFNLSTRSRNIYFDTFHLIVHPTEMSRAPT